MKTDFETIDRAQLQTATGGVVTGGPVSDLLRGAYNNGLRRLFPSLPEMPKPPQLPPGVA